MKCEAVHAIEYEEPRPTRFTRPEHQSVHAQHEAQGSVLAADEGRQSLGEHLRPPAAIWFVSTDTLGVMRDELVGKDVLDALMNEATDGLRFRSRVTCLGCLT